ncbi:MAG: methyltransferase type 11 [uncultured bacterium]|nr:MAG: methyltransferase type 11 [uncultured bacterium]
MWYNIVMKNSLLWDIYAKLYDTLNLLEPYQKLHQEVLQSLELKGGERILDAGCGTGNFEKLLQNKGLNNVKVEALDFSQAMLKRAKRKNGNHSFNFQHFDINDRLPFPDNHFDRVVSVNAVYALKEPFSTLQEFYRVLRPGGKILITNPKYCAKILPIFFEHAKKAKMSEILFMLPSLTLIGIFNLFIKLRGAKNVYNFFDQQELWDILQGTGYLGISINLVYANQTLLAVGKK